MTRFPRLPFLMLSCAALMLAAACGPSDPQKKVAQLRSYYTARLNGFLVQQPEPAPMPEVEEAAAGEAAVAAAAEAAPEGEEMAAEVELDAGPQPVDIMLDILIQHDSPEHLPGITVDISMVDAAKAEKGSWRVWFDTAQVAKANVTQYTHVLEDVLYEEGDGFSVEVRHPIPPEQRGEYREFPAGG